MRTAKFELVWRRIGCKDWCVIERILRVAQSFEEVEEFDRQDMARLSLEERVKSEARTRSLRRVESSAYLRWPKKKSRLSLLSVLPVLTQRGNLFA